MKFVRQEFQQLSRKYASLIPSFQVSWSRRYLEPNCTELMQKTSLTLQKDFGEQRSHFFRNNVNLCPPQFAYLKFS